MRRSLLTLPLLVALNTLPLLAQDPVAVVQDWMRAHNERLGLTGEEAVSWTVTSRSTDKKASPTSTCNRR